MAEGPDPGLENASPTPSLLDLSNELNCVSWHSLGVKLGLEGHQLDAVEEGHRGSNERLKNEMLILWLRSAKNPSWKAVVKALRLMKEHRVADRIQQKYCDSTATEVPTNGDQSDHLSVTSSATISPRVDPLTSSESSFVGSSGRRSGRGRGKGRGKNRTPSTPKNGKAPKPGLITEDAPEDCTAVSPPILSGDESTPEPGNGCSTDTEFPDLSPKTLSDFELGRLKFTLKKASQEIVIKFASLEHNTISMLRERKVPLSDVKNYVLSLGAVYNESAYKGRPLLLQQEDKIESTDDFGPLFLIVKLYYSWFNYHILEALRKEFLFLENVDEQLDKYKSDLHDYCRRRCFECPKDMFSNSSAEGFVSLCFKINDEFEVYSLNHVKQFQYSLSDILGLPNYVFQLCDVTDGCVTIVFRIPSQLADVITISSEQQQKLLLIGVKQLRIMTRIVFEEEDFSLSQLQQKVTGNVTTGIEQHQIKLEPPMKSLQTCRNMNQLHSACKRGKFEEVTSLLNKKECDINALNTDGESPLHIACGYGHLEIVKVLLMNLLCELNTQNSHGDTPLHLACYSKSLAIVRLLLEMKCSTNIPNMKGETAQDIPLDEEGDCLLHIACQWGDVDIVRYLITDEKCNPNAQNFLKNTPLHASLNVPTSDEHNQSNLVALLLSSETCDPNIHNKEGDTPLHIAVRENRTSAISHLLTNKHCNLNVQNKEGDTPLHTAIKQNVTAPVSQLLATTKCDPNIQNTDSETPLHIAVRQQQDDTVVQLLSREQCNSNIQNKEGDTPLHIACYNKSLNIIRLFLERKCSTNIPNKKGETAQDIPLNEDGDCLLHIACQWGDVDIVGYLIIDEKCNPNAQNFLKNTPLHASLNVPTSDEHSQSNLVALLLSSETCDPNIHNKEGDTPLHIAVRENRTPAISHLLTNKHCNLNVQNKEGDTPLHTAIKQNVTAPVSQLLATTKCDPNIQNTDSETPLHIAVRQQQDDTVVQLLSRKECNSNIQNKEGDTPLHIACYNKSLNIIRLLLERKCSTNILNKKGETAQDISVNEEGDCLLHIACQWGDVEIVKYLITDERCNPNLQNTKLDTPLHIACYAKSLNIIRLLLEMKCSINIPNKKGETAQYIPLNEDGDCLLHIACQWGDVEIVEYLITDKKCNPNVQNFLKNTPLHASLNVATSDEHSQSNLVALLLSSETCDPNIHNKEGDTPLHIAVSENRTSAISHFLNNKQCNPNVLNNDHFTPLLTAIKHNNHTIATALLQHKDCDATLSDPYGNTPLHLACMAGETQPGMIEAAKQLLTLVDPSCVNSAGQRPIELTTNYQLRQAISHMVQCKTKQSVQTYINMFIVGNPETGKSTLVKAICDHEGNSIRSKRFIPKQARLVKNVPLHTAGIIPTTLQSKTFGNTVLYDLAGQVEYYTSHAAVIRSTVISTPPVFIVVVNLSESEEKISQTLRYWWSFIDNHAARSSAPPEMILVGSHADVLKSTGGSVQEKMTQLPALLKQLPTSFHFAGQVALDCRDPASRELRLFCSLVNQSCSVLRQTADVDLRCHVLYAFLLERFKGKVACTVSDVATSIKETSALLPQKLNSLIPLISTLSDKGLLLLVKGGETYGDWWIILQKQALLSEIVGAIFAPKNFRQYKDLSWSTGVFPFFKLKQEFPDYNPNMVFEFLTHLEFCFKIEDHETLALLKDEATNAEYTSPDVSEEYYFFPALVSVDNPSHVWEESDVMCCKCGWFYECIQPDQFLTTQFLHVLILRLAFTFALKLNPGDYREDSLFLRRKCSVWKHGIGWLNWVPIETVVEVGLQCQSVIVMMRCPKGEEAKCAQLRSEVIQKVLEVKDEHCKAVKMSESFINPTDIRYPFTDNMEDVKFYLLTEIARGIVCKGEKANALDRSGRNPIPVQDLLLFDPYSTDTGTELLRELFSRKHSMKETVRSELLETLNKDTSKPKFADSERRSVMNQFDPVTLHSLQTDATTMRAVQLFARQVVFILHTCNVNEYWAALERLEPPTKEDESEIRGRPIIYPQVGSVIGWFAGYRTAVVRTGQGNRCRDELTTTLTKSFPNSKAVIGAGIAYANDKKRKFADVLISDQIENFVQYMIVDGKITNRGPREQIDPNVQRVFENPARDWTDMKHFICTDDNQTSVAHIGCIVSAPTLVRDELLRDQLMKHTPDCIGGEMEGWVLLELKRTLKSQHNKDIKVIVIKGVTDYGDCTMGDHWQWTAAKAAMDCIHYCLNKSGGIEFGATPQPAAIKDMEPEAFYNTTPPSTKLTLPELLRFTCTDGRVINIPVEIATKYVWFGTFLLDDRNGSRIKIMARKLHYDAEEINTEILQEWLTEKGKQPVNWATLVEVLRDIELTALAGEIEAVKCPQGQSPTTC